jgi:uncharacterized protein DUF6788
MNRKKASKARQKLNENEEQRQQHLKVLLNCTTLVEGSLVSVARKCGKPSCRCVSGNPEDRHPTKYLSRSELGRTRNTYVRKRDEVDIATKAKRYREFRRARAELMKLAEQTARIADELQQALTEPYPDSNK